jgi:two-component system nitrogen regulation response regulator GlnG
MSRTSNHEIDTLPFDTGRGEAKERRSVCLTVLAHPQAEMIGARAFLTQLDDDHVCAFSRLTPEFTSLDGLVVQPLGDPYASRKPTLASWRDGVVLSPAAGESRVIVGDELLTMPRRIELDALDRGVVVQISIRTALLLHRRTLPKLLPSCDLMGGSEGLETVRQQIVRAAPYSLPVLVTGETGVGKELVARALHDASPRASGPWVAANVAEIKSETAASVLFGHVRGAFTGASQDYDGLFARADGGTLFLDEIGEMAADVQAMLLRVLETGEVQRLGDRKVRKVDVRVVAATDQELDERGQLRSPLLYRLAGYQVRVPPLRQRIDDLGTLLQHFCQEEMARAGRSGQAGWFPADLVAQLAQHKWPGNARELRNLVRTLVIQADGEDRLGRGFALDAWLSQHLVTPPRQHARIVETPALTDDAVAKSLARNHWNLTATARELGIARSTLYLHIDRSMTLRTAGDLKPAELRAVWQQTKGDVDAMAQILHVSPRGLRLALRAAGLSEATQDFDDDGEPEA